MSRILPNLTSIINSLKDGLLFVDKDNLIRLCNDPARMIRGITDDPTGKNIVDCHQSIGMGKVDEIVDSLKSKRRSHRSRIIQVNGKYFEIVYSAAFSEEGEFEGIIALSRDITERKKLEKELESQTEKLRELSIRDGLTSLYNHRYLREQLDKEIVRAARMNSPVSLALFDVDGFKQYNDKFGHLKGDDLLRLIAFEIQQRVRKKFDTCYRYGGDEFVILFPNATSKEAKEILERISVELLSNEPKISLSVGIVEWREESVSTLIHKADEAMYKAKKSGGNKILVSKEILESV